MCIMMSAHQSNTHTHHLYSTVSSKKLALAWWTLYVNHIPLLSICWYCELAETWKPKLKMWIFLASLLNCRSSMDVVFIVFCSLYGVLWTSGPLLSTGWSSKINMSLSAGEGRDMLMGRGRPLMPLTTANMALSKANPAWAAPGLRFTLHNQHPV